MIFQVQEVDVIPKTHYSYFLEIAQPEDLLIMEIVKLKKFLVVLVMMESIIERRGIINN